MVPSAAVCAVARTPRPTTIAGVIARMSAIEAAIPADSGVAAFHRLYRWTTENVDRAVRTGRFERPDEMVALDVRFANLYFDAVDAWALGAASPALPGAWAPLFELGAAPPSPLRCALAGMHAHIHRDLAVAVALSAPNRPEEGTPRFRDYLLVNTVLDETSDEVRPRILPAELLLADAALGELDDIVILGLIRTARRAAWDAGEVLYRLRDHPTGWRAAVAALDLAVGRSARLLLHDPSPDWLHVPSWGSFG